MYPISGNVSRVECPLSPEMDEEEELHPVPLLQDEADHDRMSHDASESVMTRPKVGSVPHTEQVLQDH